MADAATKQIPIITDINSLKSFIKTRKSAAFIYGFMFAFVSFTVFLAFNPSPNTYAPWFSNIFSVSTTSFSFSNNTTTTTTTSSSSSSSNSHQFSSIFNSMSPTHNSSLQASNSTSFPADNGTVNDISDGSQTPTSKNHTKTSIDTDKAKASKPNSTSTTIVNTRPSGIVTNTSNTSQTQQKFTKSETLKPNQTASGVGNVNTTQTQQNLVKTESLKSNQTENGGSRSQVLVNGGVNGTGKVEKEVIDKANNTASLSKKSNEEKKQSEKMDSKKGLGGVESLVNCELFDGEWVKDDSYPLYKPGSCSVTDEQFNCITNGRPDKEYQKYKWKPNGCNLPRLDAGRMLELLRGKRLVFVGDSLNRNMWESLVCILQGAVKDKKKVYEANGRQHFRGEASSSFIFKDYDCTVEFYVTPFLVQEWEVVDRNGSKKETLRLDLVGKSSDQYKGADIIVFNTGHWWTHDKTSKGEDYYQEGSHVYKELNVLEAFRKALTTWSRWVDANVNPAKSLVLFRGYSASHFSGGQWNSGGACDHEVEPIKNATYLKPYPSKMIVLERVLKGMKTQVKYLNVTRMTDYRKDGHPSMYRKHNMAEKDSIPQLHIQDCSHWCLPGVPDTWNEILYAELLINEYQKKQQAQRTVNR